MKSPNRISVFLVLVLATVLLLVAPKSLAQAEGWVERFFQSDHGVLIEFDGPDATNAAGLGTQAFANNDFGAVVGYWVDSQIIPHAFVRSPEGKFTGFDAKGADLNPGDNGGTVAYAINNAGEIAGQYEDTNFVFHAFIRYPNGVIVEFDDLNAGTAKASPSQGTVAANINARGDTAGYYVDSDGNEHGFIRYRDGNIVTVDPDNSLGTMICLESCLADDGTVTGFYFDSTTLTVRGFIRSPDNHYTIFDGPDVDGQAPAGTIPASINVFGVTAGYSFNAEVTALSFVRASNGKIYSFQDPSASPNAGLGTTAFALNLWGATTGAYQDSNGGEHGFESTPNSLYANFDAPDSGDNCVPALFLCQGTRPSTNNFWGEATGWYVDSCSVSHGLIWIPGRGSFQPEPSSPATGGQCEAGTANAPSVVAGRASVSAAASNSSNQSGMKILSHLSPRDMGARNLLQKWLGAHSY
jgi:uncharacterized membrane protein